MPRSAFAIRRHLPGLMQWECCVAGCQNRTDQRHHVDYDADEEWGHRSFPMCEDHHAQLHRLHDDINRQIPLLLFSCNFIVDPQATALRAVAMMSPQLSFADLPTHEGEAWRTWVHAWGPALDTEWERLLQDLDDVA